ncbi:MAG: hypothetical protein RL264_912 [Bacteroidota bacterium]|jgi:lysophospholipase L1-like esterase
MKKITAYIALVGVAMGIVACKPKYKTPDYSKGEMNPTTFVMIGGGHAAGYMDDGLTYEGQQTSVAKLIADQLKFVGGGDFKQSLVDQNSIGISLLGLSPLKMGYKTDCQGVTSLSPVRVAMSSGDMGIWSDNAANGPFNNFSIPGLQLADLWSATVYNSNPFYKRIGSSSTLGISSLMQANPTFFSVFLGLEEALVYAKSGGTVSTFLTDNEFETKYTELVDLLTANGAKGALATIPDVTQMPYFTTIPWNGLNLDSANAATLTNVFNQIGFTFEIGANPFMIVDPDANQFAVRQIAANEKLLLSIPLDSVKCHKLGVLYPFRNEFVLNNDEIQILNDKVNAYNAIIRQIAQNKGLAIVETNDFVSKLTSGFLYNGVALNAKFVTGGSYSLDGIYFNARGNGLFANEFIKAINKKYKSTIPQVDANKFSATKFP